MVEPIVIYYVFIMYYVCIYVFIYVNFESSIIHYF